jgi:GNAT superfamily N-acetyltransferase
MDVACSGLCRYDADTVRSGGCTSSPKWRGWGYSRLLLGALEEEARRLGYSHIRLETGVRQPPRSAFTARPASSRSRATGRTRTTI